MRNEAKELIYIHLQVADRFVLSSGISFQEFYLSLEKPLQNVLLLKHQYQDTEYNMNTLLEFVYQEDLHGLVKGHADKTGEFCWIDFQDEAGLNELGGQELAELLYLGHCKHHLRPPFYRLLNNDFAYLSYDNGSFNKVFYRSMDIFYHMLGNAIPRKMFNLKVEKNWLGIRKKNEYTPIPVEILKRISTLMVEGMVLSFEKISQTRNRLEVPVWVIGDYMNTDDIVEQYAEGKKNEPDAKLIYTRKTKEWSLVLR
ncbi:MAG: hypothetical protein ACI35P_16570 [Bacillus sp. (in: firmicutes)]